MLSDFTQVVSTTFTILKKNVRTSVCPGGGHDNPLQCSCLENSMDKKALWATVYRVAKSQTPLKRPSTHTHICVSCLLYSSVLFIFFICLLTDTSVVSISWLL